MPKKKCTFIDLFLSISAVKGKLFNAKQKVLLFTM